MSVHSNKRLEILVEVKDSIANTGVAEIPLEGSVTKKGEESNKNEGEDSANMEVKQSSLAATGNFNIVLNEIALDKSVEKDQKDNNDGRILSSVTPDKEIENGKKDLKDHSFQSHRSKKSKISKKEDNGSNWSPSSKRENNSPVNGKKDNKGNGVKNGEISEEEELNSEKKREPSKEKKKQRIDSWDSDDE